MVFLSLFVAFFWGTSLFTHISASLPDSVKVIFATQLCEWEGGLCWYFLVYTILQYGNIDFNYFLKLDLDQIYSLIVFGLSQGYNNWFCIGTKRQPWWYDSWWFQHALLSFSNIFLKSKSSLLFDSLYIFIVKTHLSTAIFL